MARLLWVFVLSSWTLTASAGVAYEAEYNNDLMAANDLAIKQTMIGQLWSKDDQDWFRIKNHPVGGKLPVYLNCSFINLSVNNPFVLSFYNASNQVQTLHRVYRADCVNRSYKMTLSFPDDQDYYLVVSAGGNYVDNNYTLRVGAPVALGSPQYCPTGQNLVKKYRVAPDGAPSLTDPNGTSEWQAWFHEYCPGYINPSACRPYTYVCN